MKRSTISWTDFSGGNLNFVTGCTPASEGCQNCYARRIYERSGREFVDHVICHAEKLERLRRADFARAFPEHPANNVRGPQGRPLAFVCDTGDLFHEKVPRDFLFRAFHVMAARSDVDWQVLTKRPQNAYTFALDYIGAGFRWPPNVWLGVTAENQKRADERIPILLDIPAPVRFVSVEPMLEPIELSIWLNCPKGPVLSWVICGAESGPHRRSFDPAWAAALYRQCHEANVPFFGKQDSGYYPGRPLKISGKTIMEFPE